MGDRLLYSDYLKGLIGIALEIWPDQTFSLTFVPPNTSHSIEFCMLIIIILKLKSNCNYSYNRRRMAMATKVNHSSEYI